MKSYLKMNTKLVVDNPPYNLSHVRCRVSLLEIIKTPRDFRRKRTPKFSLKFSFDLDTIDCVCVFFLFYRFKGLMSYL